jgi:hypothetical protein
MTRARLLSLALLTVLGAAVGWVLSGAYLGTGGDPSRALRCLGVRCGGEVVSCVRDPECKAWLDCMQTCGDDKMKCPTFCGAFYQSANANAFTQCGLKNQCIALDFTGLPACGAPDVPAVPLEDVDGTWWVAGIKGPDYVLFDDCQRFVFTTVAPGQVRAQNSVPLTRGGQTRIARNEGLHTRTDGGVMRLEYENYPGYFERWQFTHRFAHSMLAYVCSSAGGDVHDYGAFILTRGPLADLGADERAALEAALREAYHLELGALTPLKTTGCANQ